MVDVQDAVRKETLAMGCVLNAGTGRNMKGNIRSESNYSLGSLMMIYLRGRLK
jgi:hypothetical protein